MRYDNRLPFTNPSSWEKYANSVFLGMNSNFERAVVAEKYIIFVPSSSGKFSCYDTSLPFNQSLSYQTFDVQSLSISGQIYFAGGCFDSVSRFAYFPATDQGSANFNSVNSFIQKGFFIFCIEKRKHREQL